MFQKYLQQIQQVKNNTGLFFDGLSEKIKKTKLSPYPFNETSNKTIIEIFPRDFFIETEKEQQHLVWSIKSMVIANGTTLILKQKIQNGVRRYFIICDESEQILKLIDVQGWQSKIVDSPGLPLRMKENIFQDFVEVMSQEDEIIYSRSFFMSSFPTNHVFTDPVTKVIYTNLQYLPPLYNLQGDSEVDYIFELLGSNKYSSSLMRKDTFTFQLSEKFAKVNNARIRNSKEQIDDTSNSVAKGELVVNVTVNVKLVDDSIQSLLKRSKALKKAIQIAGGELSSYIGEQLEAFCSFDSRSKLKIQKNVKIDVLLANAVCLFPFRYVSQGDVSGVAIGTTNGSNFYFDTRRNDVRNVFALGDSGMGKTQSIKNLVKINSELKRYQLIIDGAKKDDSTWDFDETMSKIDKSYIDHYKYDNTDITEAKATQILLKIQSFYEKCKSLRSVNPNLEFVVIIDEVWNLLKFKDITDKLIQLSKAGRKSSFSFYGATHDIKEMDEQGARTMRQMFDIYFLFKTYQSEFMRQIKLINDNEVNYLSSRDTQRGDCLVKIFKLDNQTDMSYRVKLFENITL